MAEKITLRGSGNSKIEIKQSVFIGQACHIETAQEAVSFVDSVRKEYSDARHNCYAWRVSGETFMQKYSDDGEPSGTAGMPMLSVLDHKNITDCCVVVTRYFGGILLGTGGLVRAYTEAAQLAVENAGIVTMTKCTVYEINAPYNISDKVISLIEGLGISKPEPEYGADVKIRVICPDTLSELFIETLRNGTAARVEAHKTGEGFFGV